MLAAMKLGEQLVASASPGAPLTVGAVFDEQASTQTTDGNVVEPRGIEPLTSSMPC